MSLRVRASGMESEGSPPPEGTIVRRAGPCLTEVELRKRAQLINRYGSGRLVDLGTSRIIEEDDIPGDYSYIVGLPEGTVSFLRILQERGCSMGGANLDRVSLLSGIGSCFGVLKLPEEGPSLVECLTLLDGADAKWLDGLLSAMNRNPEQGLLEMIGYVSSSKDVAGARVEDRRMVHQALGLAWEQEFVDPGGVVDCLYKTLCTYVQSWQRDSRYVAAWTALIQSSGWGKSRAVCQLWTKGVYVIYVSFMSLAGFPARTAVADTIDARTATDPRLFAAWTMALLGVLADYITQEQVTPEEWVKLQFVRQQEVRERVKNLFRSLAAGVRSVQVSAGQLWSDDRLTEWMSQRCNEHKIVETVGGTGSLKVLICLDEAGSFFTAYKDSFLVSRRAFSCIPRGSGIFGILMDTRAKLEVFDPPPKDKDPSLKALIPDPKCFGPLWSVGCIHRDWETLLAVMKSQADITQPSQDVTRELFKWGRPLWSAALSNGASVAYLVNFACEKLVGGQAVSKVNEGMAMALIGVAAGLEVAAWSDLAKDLVGSHMRTATFVSEDRDRIFSADAMEPILGEAAARVLHRDGVLPAVLDVAEKVCKQPFVVEGPRGELVGRLFLVALMHAYYRDSAVRTYWNRYSRPVPLAGFLSKLCRGQQYHDGLICFNRCIVLSRKKITRRHLLVCFICAVAIIPRRGKEAFDLLVPRLMPGPDGKYELRVERMQAIPIQFKNREKPWSDITSLQKFAHTFATFPEEMPAQEGEEPSDGVDDGTYVPGEQEGKAGKRIRRGSESSKILSGLGIFMHIRGELKVGQNPQLEGNVLVVHDLDCLDMEEDVLNNLRRLRKAYFKVEDLYGCNLLSESSQAMRDTLYNYIKPLELKTLEKLTVGQLRDMLKQQFGHNKLPAEKDALVKALGDCLKIEDADWMTKVQT